VTELDPFDASILHVLARVSEDKDLQDSLLGRLSTEEGKKIAHAILADPGQLEDISEDVRVTAASLKRAVGRR
jgi:hypothetical protein